MSEHREALERIMQLCSEGQSYTRRTQAIHEVAMKALGLTANQRRERHEAVFERTGDEARKVSYLARRAKFDAYIDAMGKEAGK